MQAIDVMFYCNEKKNPINTSKTVPYIDVMDMRKTKQHFMKNPTEKKGLHKLTEQIAEKQTKISYV